MIENALVSTGSAAPAATAAGEHVDDAATVLREISAYAKTTAGDNLQRYSAVQDFAFRNFAQMLNAKQLREMVGSGSQTTAQAAIKEFRESLQKKLKHRLNMGTEIPEHLGTLASELIGQIWSAARDAGQHDFELDRKDCQRQVAEASEKAALSESDRESALRQLDEMAQAQRGLRADIEALSEALRAATSSRDQLERQRDAQLATIDHMQGDIDRLLGEARRSDLAHAEALAVADARIQNNISQHRENIAQLGRRHDAAMDRLTKSADADRAKLEKVSAELADTTLLLARVQRDAALDRERFAVMTNDVVRLQAEGERLQAALASSESRNQSLETLLLAKGFDHDGLIKWLQAGADSALPGLAGTEALVAGAVLHQIERLRVAAKPASKAGKL